MEAPTQALPTYPQAPPEIHGPPAWPPGYAPPGYSPAPEYPVAGPNYPGPPGYPSQQHYAPVPTTQQPSGLSRGWLVGGTAAAVLAMVGIGIGIYFAVSGGSGGQARLLTTPAIPASATLSSQTASTASHRTVPVHRQAQSSPSLPPSVTAATPTISLVKTSPIGERQSAANTIQRHFSLISQHRFAAAYALLAPSLQSGEGAWISSHQADGIYQVNVDVNAILHSPDSATASVVKMTTLDGHGCKTWSGSWGLSKINGQWRISQANVSFTRC